MPDELKTQIADKLRPSIKTDISTSYRDLVSLSAVETDFRRLMATRHDLSQLSSVLSASKSLAHTTVNQRGEHGSWGRSLRMEKLQTLEPLMPLLLPEQREQVLRKEKQLSKTLVFFDSKRSLSRMPAMAYRSDSARQQVVHKVTASVFPRRGVQALSSSDAHKAAEALMALSKELKYLNEEQCDCVVTAATQLATSAGLGSSEQRWDLLHSLYEAESYLSPASHSSLKSAVRALDMTTRELNAREVGPAIADLPSDSRTPLIRSATHGNDGVALGSLCGQVGRLSEPEARAVISAAFSVGTTVPLTRAAEENDATNVLEPRSYASALRGLGSVMHMLTPTQCQQAVEVTVNLQDEVDRAHALSGFYVAMPHLPADLRQTIFSATLRLPTQRVDGAEHLQGLAVSVPFLTSTQCRDFLRTAIQLSPESEKLQVMSALCKQAAHFGPEEQQTLMQEVTHLLQSGTAAQKGELLAGLAVGLGVSQSPI